MSVGFQEKILIASKGKVMIADFAHNCRPAIPCFLHCQVKCGCVHWKYREEKWKGKYVVQKILKCLLTEGGKKETIISSERSTGDRQS